MKKHLIPALALALFAFCQPCLGGTAHAAYDGPKLKFRVAHTTPPGNHIPLAFEKFKEACLCTCCSFRTEEFCFA